MSQQVPIMRLTRLGIDTYEEAIVYIRADSQICRSEGFASLTRVRVTHGAHWIIATLNIVKSDILKPDHVSLSEYAWDMLHACEGGMVRIAHAHPVPSLPFIRRKVYGHALNQEQYTTLINDIVAGRLSHIHLSAFLSACTADRLSVDEMVYLTKSMVSAGQRLSWRESLIVDKHCVGGLPGNRTTLIVVPIVAAFGLTIPKTSSRAITSPAGTADTMEVLAPVDLKLKKMREVVEKEGGCVIWGGMVSLSPADEKLIYIERSLNFDSEGQMVASVLSKKVAAGSNHVVIDIPIGDTAKVRSESMAHLLKSYLIEAGSKLGLQVTVLLTDGSQPIGRGIGPALEARDVLAVLQNLSDAPQDLRERSLYIAGHVLEFSKNVAPNDGYRLAKQILESGQAWKKFQAIAKAQGGIREPTHAKHTYTVHALQRSRLKTIDNRMLAQVAVLAGAPRSKAAGIDLNVKCGEVIEKGQPLFTLHSESRGELEYAMDYYRHTAVFSMDQDE